MLLSALVLPQGASLVNVHADTTDDKIAAQNKLIALNVSTTSRTSSSWSNSKSYQQLNHNKKASGWKRKS